MPQESSVSSSRSLTIASLQSAVQQAVRTGGWVVAVYPTTEASEAARNLLPALLPDGASGGGRTALLPGGGRVSVVASLDPPFQTSRIFGVMFLGWGGAKESEFGGMSVWRAASTQVLAEEGRAA